MTSINSLTVANPTRAVSLDFPGYLTTRESKFSKHMTAGVPDYAFSMDLALRQKLSTLPPVRAFARALTASVVPMKKQEMQMTGVAVGPRQFPDIYDMAEKCGRTLGIAVPQIFIVQDPQMNAYTMATDDSAPMVVVHSSLVHTMNPQELLFVIGHECGHIHNFHSTYNTMAVILSMPTESLMRAALGSVPGFNLAMMAAQKSFQMFLSHWSRCAEVTADRAGMICCGDLRTGQTALAKLATGGFGLDNVNIDELLKQIEQTQQSPARFNELMMDHPLIPKRIDALRRFANCDVLFDWHPEMRGTGKPETHKDVDDAVASYINVFSKGYHSPATGDTFSENAEDGAKNGL